jgi:hypothetical protein
MNDHEPEFHTRPAGRPERWRAVLADLAAKLRGRETWKKVQDDWDGVKHGRALLTVIAAILVVSSISGTWVVVSHVADAAHKRERDEARTAEMAQAELYTRKIGESDEREMRLREEVAELKRQRDKADSDLAPWKTLANLNHQEAPADKRLDLLLNEVRELKAQLPPSPRVLTPFQKLTLIPELKRGGSFEVAVSFAALNSEITAYSEQFKAALREAGWRLREAPTRVGAREGRGVRLLFKDRNKLPPGTKELLYALTQTGIKVELNPLQAMKEDELELYIGYR